MFFSFLFHSSSVTPDRHIPCYISKDLADISVLTWVKFCFYLCLWYWNFYFRMGILVCDILHFYSSNQLSFSFDSGSHSDPEDMANQHTKKPRVRSNRTPTHSQVNGVQATPQASPASTPSASMPTMSPGMATKDTEEWVENIFCFRS
jgi:hypothetical protein